MLRAAGLSEFVNVLHSRLFREALRQGVPMTHELQRFVVAQAHMIKLNLKKDQHFRCAQDLGELSPDWNARALDEQCAGLASLGRDHTAARSWRRAIQAGIEVMRAHTALEENLRQSWPYKLRRPPPDVSSQRSSAFCHSSRPSAFFGRESSCFDPNK